ncbi:hypothetical protein [Desulfonema magnum]|uniref:Dockerin domain-containing protein n=1 Tax=Desulfonema magnum TaxID=45655 RepID=A0A975GSW1_9BACT|nr:hypothetical protein [Desulfonema magnum]QTA92456.1 Uncharacterized protein dnm_085360 [Desulfonema magnum]
MKGKKWLGQRYLLYVAVIMCAFIFMGQSAHAQLNGDINDDGKIGLAEAIWALQVAAGIINPMSDEQRESLEDVTNAAALALADNEKTVQGLQEMVSVMNYMGLDKATSKKRDTATLLICNALKNLFACGTVEMEGQSVIVFTFSGDAGCDGVSGTVKVTPSAGSFSVAFDNVTKGDCVIHGNSQTTLSAEGDQISATHIFDNMAVCGQNLNGTVTMIYDKDMSTFSVSGESQNTFSIGQSDVTVPLTFSYSSETGVSGSTTMMSGDESYVCTFSNIKPDATCCIPVSGTLTLNDIELNFSDTTCENPVVAVTSGGLTFSLNLEEAKNMAMGTNEIK